MTNDPKSIALAYIDACGRKDYEAVAPLLAPELHFVGPSRNARGAAAYLAVLRTLGPVWLRSDVKKAFADGPDVCVIYDFVTNTEAGAVPIVEWLHVEAGRIASVHLYFDRQQFKPASDEIQRRAAG